MPNRLMPSLFDENGNFTKSVGDNVEVAIYNINDKGFITLSDITTYEKEQEKLRKKEEKAVVKQRAEGFASLYESGTIFEAEVIRVQNSKAIIQVGDVQGVIKKEDTNWNEIDRLGDVLYEGEIINAVYIKNENGILFFSLKLLNEKPYDETLYDLSLSDLLKYIGHDSNVFIGIAKQYHYGMFIENLYSASTNQRGRLLIDPVFGYNLRAIVPNANFHVEENKYYHIELRLAPKNKRLERNQLFQFAAINIQEIENPYKADVNLTFAKSTSPRDCAALAHTLAEVGKNMYSSKDRMFFELVQNADDAAAQKGVYVNVKAQGEFLIVRHNGNSFDKDDFNAITSSANGTKKANENKTGYKGIGFKSVFTDSEIVFIKTGGYQFKFDKNDPRFNNFEEFYFYVNGYNTKQQQNEFLQKFSSERSKFRGVSDIPWQLEPIWIDDYPTELGEEFTQSNVAIALKLGESKILGDNGYGKAIADIISNPRFMLFLRNTKRIDFNGLSVSKTTKGGIITLKNSFGVNRIEHFKRKDFDIRVNNDVFEENGIDVRIVIEEQNEISGKIIEAKFVDTHNQELENIPKKIAINNSTVISFAIPIDEDGILKPNTKCNEISMFAFLPTLVKDFKFPFYINANFILDPPRQRILGDNPWNFYLMQEIARNLVSWCALLNEKQDNNALNILLSKYFEDQSADTRQLAEHFNSAYKSALESEAFILNHKGELARQNEIIIDKTSLSEIIGADLFCKLLETEKCLPSEKIDSKILEEDIFEHIETLKFDDVIGAITDNEDFNEWFVSATDEQKKTLYKWIDENNIKTRENDLCSFVSNLPLFQFGEEYKSCKETETTDYIITTEHIAPVKDVLSKLGFVCSDNVFDKNHPIYKFVKQQNEGDLFNSIVDRDFSELTIDERKSLFFALRGFKCVEEKLKKDIAIFKNVNGIFKPLGEMFAYRENIPAWLYEYVLSKEDYDADLANYLISQEDEFEEVIWKHRDEFGVAVTDLYREHQWTDEKYTQQLISQHKANDNSYKQLLPIIEKSGENTKRLYLQNIERMDLTSGEEKYKKDSYEYRVLQLALEVLDEPSEFSSKIYFDGRCIKDFTISDDVLCEYTQNGEKKKVKMSLAKLLPQYQNLSTGIEQVLELFERRNGIDKFFATASKPLEEIFDELNEMLSLSDKHQSVWPLTNTNVQQYFFSVYYRKEVFVWYESYNSWSSYYKRYVTNKKKGTTSIPNIELSQVEYVFSCDLMDWLCNNDISIQESPFTYHLKHYFADKYFDSNYIFENEQLLPVIEQWADTDKKKKYLKDNGVQTSNCNAIQFRKLFLENKPINFIDKLSDEEIKSGIEFIATANGFEHPFVGEHQKIILLSLKDKCKDLTDHWDNKKMEEKGKEWDTKEYKEWIEDHIPRIFIYPGILPSQLSYKDEILLNYDDTEYDYYYNKQEKKLFVSNARKIEDILFEVAKEGKTDLDFDDYKELCLEGKVSVSKEDIEKKDKTIKSLSEENRKKDEIIEDLQAKLKAYEDVSGITEGGKEGQPVNQSTPTPNIGRGENQPLSTAEKIAAQIDAQKKLMEIYPNWEYPEGFGEGGSYSYFNIKKTNGELMSIVLKSHRTNAPLHVNTNEWDWIMGKKGDDFMFSNNDVFQQDYPNAPAKLFIYTGDDIKELDPKYLIENQPSIALSFSTENLNIEDRITAFSDSLHYFNEMTFDFESFNLSNKAKSIKGLYNKHLDERQNTENNSVNDLFLIEK